MPSTPMGRNSAAANDSSGSFDGAEGSLAVFRALASILACLRCGLVAQRAGHGAHQRGGRGIREDAIVVDHDGRREDVAKIAADAEFAIVAVAGQSASTEREHYGRYRQI